MCWRVVGTPFQQHINGLFLFKIRVSDVCFFYVNEALFKGKLISKIGITVNLRKRLCEFNNGLRYRARYYPDLKGVSFYSRYSTKLATREDAVDLERLLLRLLKSKIIFEFGREVFNVPSEIVIDSLANVNGGGLG